MRIVFLNGSYKGQDFLVQKGLILTRQGKKKKEISLSDARASNPHAEIIWKNGEFFLQDKNSKNGTYVEGQAQDIFLLEVGLKFQIGNTFLEVRGDKSPKKFWWKELPLVLGNIVVKDKVLKPLPFVPPLLLHFKSGPQKGERWHVCYGPRTAGPASLDILILEPKAPEICFSLKPISGTALFQTLYPEKVLLNRQHISRQVLSSGDTISFFSTLIEVSYHALPASQKMSKKLTK